MGMSFGMKRMEISAGQLSKLIQLSVITKVIPVWLEGKIDSRNHGRLIILPYKKSNGDFVNGHTKNCPHDGPAKPRHSSQYVSLPFHVLEDDLMIGLFGELPYE